ncbi:MAG TPA: oxidoreductase, partial [Planctomycetes bacterium]|nr:oxidoreductase [Planctomycetota bacterium]
MTLLVMVSLLGLVLFAYGQSYLEGSPRRGVFLARIAQVLFAVECLLLAGNLVVFVAAWTGASLALHRLLLFFPERRRAQLAARKKFLVARLGDLALLGAFALLVERFGTGELGALFEAAAGAAPGPALTGATLLIAFAALLKSAQFPTHG